MTRAGKVAICNKLPLLLMTLPLSFDGGDGRHVTGGGMKRLIGR